MIALILAAQLTVIVQMEQHQTIEAQGDSIVTNEWRDYVFSAPREIGQLQSAQKFALNTPATVISNSIASEVTKLLLQADPRCANEEIMMVLP